MRFLLQGLVIGGAAWGVSALAGSHPGGRYQGQAAGMAGAFLALLVLACINAAVTRWRAASRLRSEAASERDPKG